MKEKINWDSWVVSIGLVVAWIVASIGALFAALYIREAIISIATLFQVASQQAYKAAGGIGIDFTPGRVVFLFDNIMLFTLGIGVVAVAIWIEYYFRKGRPQGLLIRRIVKVLGIEIAVIVVSIIIRLVVYLF